MTEVKDSSSLPLLLSITGAVLAVAVGGWFLLNKDQTAGDAAPAAATEQAPVEEATPVVEETTESEIVPDIDVSVEVDAELRKARLAAEADILIFPATQSALYYYGRVLRAEPGHPIANAELDATLAQVARTVSQHLAAEEFGNAHEIATLVARQRPEHDLVLETQRTLDGRTEQLVAEAIQHAQDGNDQEAADALDLAAALPGRNPAYFTAVRASMGDIQDVRQAAEQDRAQRAQLADDEARAAWVTSIRNSISGGNLISPAGASARDLLSESNSWETERTQLTGEVVAALIVAAQEIINAKQPTDAEPLINAAVELGGNADEFDKLSSALENAYVELESNRVASMSELVRVKAAAPRYPRRAQERDVSGWVDIYFTVTADGETADVSVNRSEPKSVFDRAAIDAVEKWAFQPVEYRGQIISQRAATRLVFQLE